MYFIEGCTDISRGGGGFQRKPKATCDFPGGGSNPLPPPPSGSAHVCICFKLISEKHAICLKDYRIRSFLSIRQAHGDLCKHLGIDSSIQIGIRIYS